MREPILYKIDVATGHENALLAVYRNKEVIGYCNLVDDAMAIIREAKDKDKERSDAS